MGLKGLLRDVAMFVIGIGLFLNWFDSFTAGVALIAIAAAFTAYAFFRLFKG